MTVTPQEAVDVANHEFGRHPGYRALHAKGTLCHGTFTASPDAAQLTSAAHMQGEPVPVTVRVSNGSGNPNHPDYVPDVRGLAVKFYLPNGSRADIVCQSIPRFPVRTPEEFVELLRAQHRDVGMLWRVPVFAARHLYAMPAIAAGLPALRPPVSYATCRYYGVHAYRWVGGDGGSRYVRYTFQPEAGDQRLGPRAAKARGRDYLQEEIRARMERGPVRFTLELQIAGPSDNVDDPSSVWPRERERVAAGTLELTGLDTEREQAGDILVFDPTRVTDGIELSNDPVLQFRHPAYGESVARRMA
jgi:catalase